MRGLISYRCEDPPAEARSIYQRLNEDRLRVSMAFVKIAPRTLRALAIAPFPQSHDSSIGRSGLPG